MNNRLQKIATDAATRHGMRAIMLGNELYIALPIYKNDVKIGHQLVRIETLKQLYIEMGY